MPHRAMTSAAGAGTATTDVPIESTKLAPPLKFTNSTSVKVNWFCVRVMACLVDASVPGADFERVSVVTIAPLALPLMDG